jgi:hypothetical protein
MIHSRTEALQQKTNGREERTVGCSDPERILKKTKSKIEAENKSQFADKEDVNVDDILEDRDFLIV